MRSALQQMAAKEKSKWPMGRRKIFNNFRILGESIFSELLIDTRQSDF